MIDTTASTDGEILNKNPDGKWNAIQTALIHSEIVELQAPKRPLKPRNSDSGTLAKSIPGSQKSALSGAWA